MNDYLQFKSELYHHGIKGQKWGVRRYQNKDGSLTSAGKKRYDTITQATEKAKRFEQGTKDSIAYLEKKRNISDADLEKMARDTYGDSWDDKELLKKYGEPASLDEYRQEYNKNLESSIRGAKAEYDASKKLAQQYGSLSVNDVANISKKDMKRIESFLKDGYYGGNEYSSLVIANTLNNYSIHSKN